MSDQFSNDFHHNDHQELKNYTTNPYFESNPSINNTTQTFDYGNHSRYDPSNYFCLTECLRGTSEDYNKLSRAFDLSCNPLSEAVCVNAYEKNRSYVTIKEEEESSAPPPPPPPTAMETQISNVSSVICCSDADVEEESSKTNNDLQENRFDTLEHQKFKPVSKMERKVDKKERGPRFAFMTKSEIDHLEDGYRWRKYGQKALKNSSFPRNYYKCTSPECNVKKRVERSYEDPSTIITTYEGQHNHHTPAILRRNAALFNPNSLILPSSSSSPSSLLSLSQNIFPGHNMLS